MSSVSNLSVLDKLDQVKRFYSVPDIAHELEVNPATVHRWINRQSEPKAYISDRLHIMIDRQIRKGKKPTLFSFVDLFAGIGGIRMAFENEGGECVYTSEWDEYAQKTYNSNFPSLEPIAGDITEIDAEEIPEHDVLLAGFPCQPFSIAGVSKKNALGRAHGFADATQGTLFFDVARIIHARQPKAFVLENVKNLQSHDKGRTFSVIMRTLQEELGYYVQFKIFDGQHWVPQHRERIVIVGFRDMNGFSMDAIRLPPKGEVRLKDILHRTDGSEPLIENDGNRYFDHTGMRVQDKYTLTDHLWDYLCRYAEKHRSMGNGFGYGLVGGEHIARTLSARYYKDGSEILISQESGKNPRRLTPRECARLMGYPDSFVIPVSDTRAYKQFGNSVVVPVFSTLARSMKPWIIRQQDKTDGQAQ